jgi:hypothetical protein
VFRKLKVLELCLEMLVNPAQYENKRERDHDDCRLVDMLPASV